MAAGVFLAMTGIGHATPRRAELEVRCLSLDGAQRGRAMASAGRIEGQVVKGLRAGQRVSVACRWKGGATSHAITLEVGAGRQAIEIEERSDPAAPKRAVRGMGGTVRVNARPWGRCKLDDITPAKMAPLVFEDVPPGLVTVTCTRGSVKKSRQVSVERGKTSNVVLLLGASK